MIFVAILGVVVGFVCGYPHGYLSAEIDEFRRSQGKESKP